MNINSASTVTYMTMSQLEQEKKSNSSFSYCLGEVTEFENQSSEEGTCVSPIYKNFIGINLEELYKKQKLILWLYDTSTDTEETFNYLHRVRIVAHESFYNTKAFSSSVHYFKTVNNIKNDEYSSSSDPLNQIGFYAFANDDMIKKICLKLIQDVEKQYSAPASNPTSETQSLLNKPERSECCSIL